jgi:hypothetical protein
MKTFRVKETYTVEQWTMISAYSEEEARYLISEGHGEEAGIISEDWEDTSFDTFEEVI